MPAIDWTNPGVVVVLAAFGVILILLGILFYFLPAARLKGLALLTGIGGGFAAGTALALYLMPAAAPADHGKAAESPPSEILPLAAPAPARTSQEAPQQPQPAAPAPARTSQEALDRFRQMTPAQRMTLLARLPNSGAAWYTVERGDVSTLVERGSVESADNADVVVKVHAKNPNGPATTIRKVLVDDGAMVKKGDLLIELDDSALQKELPVQQIAVERAKADAALVETDRALEIEEAELSIKLARQNVTLAERELDAYKGKDEVDKRGRELSLEQARLALKTQQSRAPAKKRLLEADVRSKQNFLELESAHLHNLETEIANCKLTAPRDGIVIFHVPERTRFGAPPPIIAPGEPVREGQKLLSIPDLTKMQVNTRIHESLIVLVRRDQTASVRVDAFPARALTGKVARVSPVGEIQRDVKVFPVAIALADNNLGLKPGMSAEVHIPMKPRRNVPRVPGQALLYNRGKVCFVKSGEEIQERPVMSGLSENDFIEITNGLQAGDAVLRDPRGVARQLAGLLPEVRGRPSPAAHGSRGKGGPPPGAPGRPAP